MSHRPRIALVTHTAVLSGAEIALERLVTAVDRRLFDPVVFCFAAGPLVGRLRDAGIETHVVELDPTTSSTQRSEIRLGAAVRAAFGAVVFTARLTARMHRAKIDVIHAHSLKADLLTIGTATLLRRPLIWHVHDRISPDYLPPRVASAFRFLARRIPSHVIVNSRATAETLVPLRQWTLAYPGLPDSSFDAAASVADPDEPIVGMLGRIGPTKGQDVFVRAAALVHAEHPRVRFRIIGAPLFGEEGYATSTKALVRELGLAEVVEFVGFVAEPGLELAGLSTLVHASPVPEPFGQVIVEAMAAGVPVVVSDAGGAAEIIRDGDRLLGQISRPGDHLQIATGIIWIMTHPAESGALAIEARGSARRRFGIEVTCSAVAAVWQQLAAGRRTRLPGSTGSRG